MAHATGVLQWMDTSSIGRIGQKGEKGVTLYVREQQECRELCLGMGQEPAESLWIRFSAQTNIGAVVVSICYRSPDQDEIDEAFFKQSEEASRSQTGQS